MHAGNRHDLRPKQQSRDEEGIVRQRGELNEAAQAFKPGRVAVLFHPIEQGADIVRQFGQRRVDQTEQAGARQALARTPQYRAGRAYLDSVGPDGILAAADIEQADLHQHT